MRQPPIGGLVLGAILTRYLRGEPVGGLLNAVPRDPQRKPRPTCTAVLRADEWNIELPCELFEGHEGKHEYLGWIE